MASTPTPNAVIEGFLLRSRRVLSHSLIREQAALMSRLHSGQFTITVTVNTKTGEESYRRKAEYPPEEALESLASRVRPLILSSEPIYQKVLDALEQAVGASSTRRSTWPGGTTTGAKSSTLTSVPRRTGSLRSAAKSPTAS